MQHSCLLLSTCIQKCPCTIANTPSYYYSMKQNFMLIKRLFCFYLHVFDFCVLTSSVHLMVAQRESRSHAFLLYVNELN